MTTTASSDPATVGLDPAALQRLVAAIQADIDQGQTAGAAIIVARGGAIGCREVLGHVAPGRAAAVDDIYLLMSLRHDGKGLVHVFPTATRVVCFNTWRIALNNSPVSAADKITWTNVAGARLPTRLAA